MPLPLRNSQSENFWEQQESRVFANTRLPTFSHTHDDRDFQRILLQTQISIFDSSATTLNGSQAIK